MLISAARRHYLHAHALDTGPRPIVRKEMLHALRNADGLLQATREQCDHLLAEARHQAAVIHLEAALEAQRQAWAHADSLMAALNAERERLMAEAEGMLAQIARSALQRLLIDVPAHWPAMSSVRLAMQEWQSNAETGEATLQVHPDDADAARSAVRPDARWKIVPDIAVERGACVLSYGQASARVSFDANVLGLIETLQQDTPATTPPPSSKDAT